MPKLSTTARNQTWLAACFLFACVQPGVAQVSSTSVYFQPDGGTTSAIVAALNNARSAIHVQAYTFTSAPIARALIVAGKRGVKVVVILDASNRTQKYSAADFLAHEGVETYIDSQHAIAHNKVMIIDGATVLTGSFNFTKAAEENNAENLLVIHDSDLFDSVDSFEGAKWSKEPIPEPIA